MLVCFRYQSYFISLVCAYAVSSYQAPNNGFVFDFFLSFIDLIFQQIAKLMYFISVFTAKGQCSLVSYPISESTDSSLVDFYSWHLLPLTGDIPEWILCSSFWYGPIQKLAVVSFCTLYIWRVPSSFKDLSSLSPSYPSSPIHQHSTYFCRNSNNLTSTSFFCFDSNSVFPSLSISKSV